MSAEKEVRNRELIKRRLADKKKWTWGKLAAYFGITRYSARDIFDRHAEKYRS